MLGEDLCIAFADMADVDAVEQSLKPARLACFDLIDQIGSRFFGHAIERSYLFDGQGI